MLISYKYNQKYFFLVPQNEINEILLCAVLYIIINSHYECRIHNIIMTLKDYFYYIIICTNMLITILISLIFFFLKVIGHTTIKKQNKNV